ncbi:hypothetical protein AMJ40_06950 [candidate division TA06 bacterium DG_26]|uniref:Uncharacterized protein n=1 Tax=candidate division TA06 bacterium DG_26 TaxID=1703771 RepID=A0A0S7WFM9_UNCT6|nr:MAG: hypothetical protein AMJ40_06950 [candidate division TA06 bacterium DG_26]
MQVIEGVAFGHYKPPPYRWVGTDESYLELKDRFVRSFPWHGDVLLKLHLAPPPFDGLDNAAASCVTTLSLLHLQRENLKVKELSTFG